MYIIKHRNTKFNKSIATCKKKLQHNKKEKSLCLKLNIDCSKFAILFYVVEAQGF